MIDLNSQIPESRISGAMATDVELMEAVAAHEAKADPHPNLWQRIVAGFLSLTGGQRILKNNPPIAPTSFYGGANHLEFTTNDGSNPILAFHKRGESATSLYHSGYGNNSLRIMNADGFDGALIHDGNISAKTAGNANNLRNLLGAWNAAVTHWDGTYGWWHLGDWGASNNSVLVRRAAVADRAASAVSADFAAGLTLDGVATKTKLIEGTTAAVQGSMVVIPIGIDMAKIISAQVLVRSNQGAIAPPSIQHVLGTQHQFEWALWANNLYVTNVADKSAALLSRPFSATITYRA